MDDTEALLRKRAEGYSYEEVTEEYVADEGELRLVRRKVSTKYAPPDVSAIKALAESEPDVARMTDEELEDLRAHLLKERDKQRANGREHARPDAASAETEHAASAETEQRRNS